MASAHLLTGEPGIGKTTGLKRLVEAIDPDRCGGFYTEEVRDKEVRTGFRIVTLSGAIGVIADVASPSSLRVGKYGVNLESLEAVGVASLYEALSQKEYVIIDEIGPMQLYSESFKRAVLDVLASSHILLGTIVLRSHPWSDELKKRPNVHLYVLTNGNRDSLATVVLPALSRHA